jgi:hypothetical protein
MPAGSVTQAALLNNNWHRALGPVANWMASHNYTGVHVDFEEGKTGPVSEALYAYFLSTFASAMQAKGLLVEVDVGEIFPVQDRITHVMQFYLDQIAGTPEQPAGKLAMMGPTYCASQTLFCPSCIDSVLPHPFIVFTFLLRRRGVREGPHATRGLPLGRGWVQGRVALGPPARNMRDRDL